MSTERVHRLAPADTIDFIRHLFTAPIAGGERDLPVLPEMAARAFGPVETDLGFGLPGSLALRGQSAAIRALVAGY